jgi:hypothetical protein
MYKAFYILIALVLLVNTAFGQADSTSLKKSDIKLKSLLALPVAENAYLHFDKPYYAAGDTIYYKAYVTMGERHQPSRVSGVLHVDLITPSNKIQQSVKLQLINGTAWGDFVLPDSLHNGSFRIRAYSQWMRNSADSAFFEQAIPVGITTKAINSAAYAKADIDFFPEGGNLVAGIKSYIAFKAVDTNGLGVYIKGVITDSDNKQVATFSSAHLGMGGFYLTPQYGKTYVAAVTYGNGAKYIVDLPAADEKGITLSVNNDSLANASVKIEANTAWYLDNKDKIYTLIIYSGGKVTSVQCKLDDPVISLDILKRRLATGVTVITLFSAENEPLCERLIFVQNYKQLSLTINSDKIAYAPQGKVNISLNAFTRAGLPAIGSFSVSVIDENKVAINSDNENTILNNLLLTSQLKGYIEQPNYYFTDITEKSARDLDLVMLTHGYRRFKWKQLLSSQQPPVKHQPEKGLEISGTAKNLWDKPLKGGVVSLMPQKGGVLSQTTNDKGEFVFSDLYLPIRPGLYSKP